MTATNDPGERHARTAARLRAAGCVFAEEEARLLTQCATGDAEVESLVRRRSAGEPLEHLLGWARFHGLRVAVRPGVFVPRRRTEFLVRRALRHLRRHGPGSGAVAVDLCCGSGAVAAALAAALEHPEIHAADLDPVAVECARANLPQGAEVHCGDLYGPLPTRLLGRVDLLTANAPYVPSETVPLLPAEARDHEPRLALDGGADGLDIQRRVIADAGRWLAPGGLLLIESAEHQADATAAAMADAGLGPRVAHSADAAATVVTGRRPQRPHSAGGTPARRASATAASVE